MLSLRLHTVPRGSWGIRTEIKQENQNSLLFPLKGFSIFKVTLADAVSVVLGVLSTSSQTFLAITLPVAPKRTSFPWWFSNLHNPQEQPLINDWQTWGYKRSLPFPLMEQRWDVTQPLFKSPLLRVTSLLGPLFFPAPLPNSPSDFSWEYSLTCHFPMDSPCLRICFQGLQMENHQFCNNKNNYHYLLLLL